MPDTYGTPWTLKEYANYQGFQRNQRLWQNHRLCRTLESYGHRRSQKTSANHRVSRKKHGVAATVEAFNVSRRTLYRWESELKAGGFEALNPISKKPRRLRKRDWSPDILIEIKRLRSEHPNLGPDKITVLIKRFGDTNRLKCPKARTVARLIADAPDKMRIYPVKVRHSGRIVPKKKVQRLRKPKHFKATHPGHCGAFDTVEKFVWGCRRYIITFVDLHSRFSFALATTSHASLAAKEMSDRIRLVFPYELEYVLTDGNDQTVRRALAH